MRKSHRFEKKNTSISGRISFMIREEHRTAYFMAMLLAVTLATKELPIAMLSTLAERRLHYVTLTLIKSLSCYGARAMTSWHTVYAMFC